MKRNEEYLILIADLLECQSGEEGQILQSKPELLDSGLWQAMKAVAQLKENRGYQYQANRLRNLARQLSGDTSAPLEDTDSFLNQEREATEYSPLENQGYENQANRLRNFSWQLSGDTSMPVEDRLSFLMKVWRATAYSGGNSQAVYPILMANLDKLDFVFLDVWHRWCQVTLANEDQKKAASIAGNIVKFSNLIQQFSLGNQTLNIEIAISGYKNSLTVFSFDNYSEDWALTQNNLGNAYVYRVEGTISENCEEAIKCYQAALKVYTRNANPEYWAMTQNNLGNAYLDRLKGTISENREEAIKCYQAALKVYTRDAYPQKWATTQNNLGNAYRNRIEGKRSENLEKAIKCYQAALRIHTRNAYPEDWATTQNNLGNAYSERAYSERIESKRSENLEKAIKCYQAALGVCTRNAYPENWAMTQENLAYTYGNSGKIDLEISGLRSALEVYTPTGYPLKCLKVGLNLGNTGFENQLWEDAIKGYGDAIEAVEILRNWEKTEQDKQKILENFLDIYNKMIQACINAGKIELAIETIERNKARSLVELLVNRDVYPRGEFFLEILAKLDKLRGQIASEQQRLSQIFRRELLNPTTDENNPTGSLQLSGAMQQQTENPQQILVALQQELQNFIQQEITPIDPEFNLTQQVKPIKFEDITALLDDSTVILEWHLSNESFHVFIITKNHAPRHWHSSLEQLQALIGFTNDYLKAYIIDKEQWINGLDQRLETLAKTICIDDILAKIPEENPQKPKYTQVILVCDSFINMFPLHALKIANNNTAKNQTTYLIDRFPKGVRYAPSCQLLAVKIKNQKQQNQNQNFTLQNLFAVANPTEDLQYTEVEVQAIQSKFNPREVLLRQQATKKAITTNRLKDKEWLHFSCHGSFSFENWQPAIILAGAVEQGDGGKIKAKVDLEKCIRLWELFNYDLRKCNLVMLSACETGLGDFTSKTQGYISLATGFLYAGSGSVVNTLWAVYAFSSAILAIKFYDDLEKNKGKNPVYLVMNEAQKWLRDVTKKDFLKWLDTVNLDAKIKDSIIVTEKLYRYSDTEQPFTETQYWGAFCAVG